MPTKPELVQFGALTPAHFARHPVWIVCHIPDYDEPWYDETDEETFRPWTGPLPVAATEGMLLARAAFVLADGSRLSGFLTPAVEGDPTEPLGLMQPQVFLPGTSRAPSGRDDSGVTRPPISPSTEHSARRRTKCFPCNAPCLATW